MDRDEVHPLVRAKDEPEAFAEFYRERYEPLVAYFARRAPAVTAEQLARVSELGDLAGLRSVVASELGKLSPEQREALRLRIVEDLSYPEVALALRISEPAARARVSRGLRSLAESLEANPAFREAGA